MKKRKDLILLLSGTLIGICAMGIVTCILISNISFTDEVESVKVNSFNEQEVKEEKVPVSEVKQEVKEPVIKEKKEDKQKVKQEVKKVDKKETKQVTKNEVKKTTKKSSTKTSIKEKVTTATADSKVITYVDDAKKNIFNEENKNKALDFAKTKFITIVDFIFYGTEINGYTFNELTEEGKMHVMNVLMEIDARIESIRPGYKEEIKGHANNFKQKAADKYVEVSNKFCERYGDKACEQAKSDIESLKESFGLTKELAKALAEKGKTSLENWYAIFKENNQ